MNSIFLEGMLLQAGLIFALGPQNLFVMESGLKRQFPIAVSFTCFLCDFALIMLGVAGAATVFNFLPQLKIFIGVIGVIFLIRYGLEKMRCFSTVKELSGENSVTLKQAILSAVSFSIFNPHAYLDGIVLIGGYSSRYDALVDRLSLGLGAASFSLIWFLLLSHGTSFLVPVIEKPRHMRFVMGSAGVFLIFLSAKLGRDVFGWIEELYPVTAQALTFTWK